MAGWVTYFVVLIKGFILVLLDLCLLVVLAFGCFWLCLRCFCCCCLFWCGSLFCCWIVCCGLIACLLGFLVAVGEWGV